MAGHGRAAIVMFAGITALALIAQVRVRRERLRPGRLPRQLRHRPQRTVIAQLAAAVFGGDTASCFFYIQAATALILILAANTAFNGFPLLGSILAEHRYLPRQLHTRGDRLAFSNGIIVLAVVAGGLIWPSTARSPPDPALHPGRVHLLHAVPDRHGPALEPGAGHRTRRRCAAPHAPVPGRSTRWAPCFTGLVLVDRAGHQVHPRRLPGRDRHARCCSLMMRAIRRHYDRVGAELAPEPRRRWCCPAASTPWCWCPGCTARPCGPWPTRRPTRPDTLTAVTVDDRRRGRPGTAATSGTSTTCRCR